MEMEHRADILRIFFALWPDSIVRRALSSWQGKLEGMGRAMRPGNLHVTLVFLGNVEASRLEALQLAASEIEASRFDLCLDEVRYWQHNRIWHAAPREVPEALEDLVSELQLGLERHGFDFDRREHKPHVTLLRNARMSDAPAVDPLFWHVRDFAMVQGGMTDYRVLARFPLV